MLYAPNYLPFDSAADSEENLTSCDDSDYSSLDSDVEDISDTETIIPDGINYSSVNGQSNASTSTKTRNSHNTVPSILSCSFIDITQMSAFYALIR